MTDHDEDARTLDTFRQMAAMQARVCYMNVDRTLATWTRTALALIVFGTVVDRYGLLLLHPALAHFGTRLAPNPVSSAGGILLVALGVFIAASAALRHRAYRTRWIRDYGHDAQFGPWLAEHFAAMVLVLGVALLGVLLVFLW